MNHLLDALKETIGKNILINSIKLEDKLLSYSISSVDAGTLVEAKLSVNFSGDANETYCTTPRFEHFEATVKYNGEVYEVPTNNDEAKTLILLIGLRVGLHNHKTF